MTRLSATKVYLLGFESGLAIRCAPSFDFIYDRSRTFLSRVGIAEQIGSFRVFGDAYEIKDRIKVSSVRWVVDLIDLDNEF